MTDDVKLPKYRCHKEVWALKIRAVTKLEDGGARLAFEEAGYAPIDVDRAYWDRNATDRDLRGGYYVVYKDGYKSWSPAEAFEDGYAPIESIESGRGQGGSS